jgi:hypothetical protein
MESVNAVKTVQAEQTVETADTEKPVKAAEQVILTSTISNCQRQEIVSARHQLMAENDRICFPYEFLSCQIRKLLCENSQESLLLAEQFWRGNWQPVHTATIICSIKSYKMRNGNLSFSTWLRCASRIIRKCYVATTNCLLDMRCLSPKRVAVLLIGLFKEAICLAVPVHLEIFHLCFSFCNIIENVVKEKKKKSS